MNPMFLVKSTSICLWKNLVVGIYYYTLKPWVLPEVVNRIVIMTWSYSQVN